MVVWNYPEEHWDELKINAVFKCIGTVREIDPLCVLGSDRSCLHFVIELCHPHVPYRVGVHPPGGRGIVLRMNATAFWPREQQFDAEGAWIPFYGPPPPPPPAAGFDLPHYFGDQAQILQVPPPAPPAPQQPPPLHPGAFLGASILCQGFINAFPLPRMPSLPLLLHLPATPLAKPRFCRATPVLLLTWHSTAPPHAEPPATLNAQPTPLPPHEPRAASTAAPPPKPTRARRNNSGAAVAQAGTRNSARLAAKDTGKFVDATTKATKLKTLQNSLAQCSKAVQGARDEEEDHEED